VIDAVDITEISPEIQGVADTGWIDWPADTEILLAALRSAAPRCKLDENEITTIGASLRAGWISPEYAIAWLQDIGLIDQVIVDEVRS
jgi:hypothetical protein